MRTSDHHMDDPMSSSDRMNHHGDIRDDRDSRRRSDEMDEGRSHRADREDEHRSPSYHSHHLVKQEMTDEEENNDHNTSNSGSGIHRDLEADRDDDTMEAIPHRSTPSATNLTTSHPQLPPLPAHSSSVSPHLHYRPYHHSMLEEERRRSRSRSRSPSPGSNSPYLPLSSQHSTPVSRTSPQSSHSIVSSLPRPLSHPSGEVSSASITPVSITPVSITSISSTPVPSALSHSINASHAGLPPSLQLIHEAHLRNGPPLEG